MITVILTCYVIMKIYLLELKLPVHPKLQTWHKDLQQAAEKKKKSISVSSFHFLINHNHIFHNEPLSNRMVWFHTQEREERKGEDGTHTR